MLDRHDIEKMSETKVINDRYYTDDMKETIKSGPLDMRFGPLHNMMRCDTCSDKLASCPGHFGYLELKLPVYHIGYFRHTVVIL